MNQSTSNFTYHFSTSKAPAEVFPALLDIQQWWSGIFGETITGKSQHIGDTFSFIAGEGMHHSEQKLVEMIPNQKLMWEVTSSKLTFLEKTDEWTGTRFGFTLAAADGKTEVTFTHEGLTPTIECYNQCSNGWMQYLNQLKKRLQ